MSALAEAGIGPGRKPQLVGSVRIKSEMFSKCPLDLDSWIIPKLVDVEYWP